MMMVQRSLIRPDQLDSNGAYNFAQLVVDGYSGGFLQDGYLMGLVLRDGYEGGGDDTIRMDANTGAINQAGTGQVTFNGNVDAKNSLEVTGNLSVSQNTTIEGDLTVNGTTTTIDTEQMVVTDPITVINASGSEIASDWTGFTTRDTDGYNRIGWMFDGYWAISDGYSDVSQPEAVPTRALAFIGAGDSNGDLSSTTDSDSGADKIGVTTIAGVTGNTVQAVLESLDSAIDTNASNIATNASNIATNASNIATNASNIATNASNIATNTSNIATNTADILELQGGTDENTWHLNQDADAGTDEDACFLMSAGDGTALIDGYLCVITDAANGDRFRFRMYQDGSLIDTDLHLGARAATDDVDAYLTLNAGDGGTAYQGRIGVDGNANMVYIAPATGEHVFKDTDVRVDEALLVDGNTTLGNADSDTLTVNATITSDLLPTDLTYQLGDEDNRWLDGYFDFFTPVNYTPVGSNYSLEGHLKGIDAAITGGGVALKPERAVYEITVGEATADTLDSSRAADQGTAVDVSGWTDADFRDYAYIYVNGQILYNDAASAANTGAVQNDVARQTGTLNNLLFSLNIRNGAVVQIIDMR
jgi:hypothetical protein